MGGCWHRHCVCSGLVPIRPTCNCMLPALLIPPVLLIRPEENEAAVAARRHGTAMAAAAAQLSGPKAA